MFSQRKNPYCDLLQILEQSYNFYLTYKYYLEKNTNFEQNISYYKLHTMSKLVFGLDLGSNSIGWAVVHEGTDPLKDPSKVISLGVRTIHFDTFVKSDDGGEVKGDPADFFNAGKGVSPNASRTIKRGMRRKLQRYKLRRKNLLEILRKASFIHDESILSENGPGTTFETLRLRARAASQPISLEELARVLLMINKKRGYKSNRKADKAEEGSLIDGMTIARRLYDEDITPGQICLEILSAGKRHLPDFYASDLQEEFDRIWTKQQQFYPDLLTPELKKEVQNKNGKDTWNILSQHWEWTTQDDQWDDLSASTITVTTTHHLEGIKRTTKGDARKQENYSWRVQALSERIDPEHLVIVLQDINQQIHASSGYLGAISDRSKLLFFRKCTVGEYLVSLIDSNPNASLKNQVFYRQDYLDEFNRIWETQASFHPELTPQLKKEIRDVVIFYQRRLKSQKNLISFCEFEKQVKDILLPDGTTRHIQTGCKVIPRSSPLFQEFKIQSVLNNLEITCTDPTDSPLFNKQGKRHLTPEEKERLALELSIRDKMSKNEVLSALFTKKTSSYQLNYDSIDGNKTGHALFKAFSNILYETGHEAIDWKQKASDIISTVHDVFAVQGWKTDYLTYNSNDNLYDQPYYRLWHLLYSYEGDNSKTGNESLIRHLSSLTGMPTEYATLLSSITFLPDYGNLSAKAIAKILPFLKEGYVYSEACTAAGYRHSASSLTAEEIALKTLVQQLPPLKKNSLRNPVVEKILNQLVNVINQLIPTYGQPDEIRVELARELKKSAKERQSLSTSIASNTKENERIKNILETEFHIAHVTRNDIIRYKLYEELKDNDYRTPYSNTYIPREKLFSNDFEIEHIIPQARLFDDSLSNKTLETYDDNQTKGKMTAYDYVVSRYGQEAAEQYTNRCKEVFKNNKAKLKKLLMTEADIPDGFIERDLRETQYISKLALSMLSSVCRNVVATTGTITDRLRNDWGLVDVMKELNWNKYKAIGKVEYYENHNGQRIGIINDWTKRNDHRHHAVDAVTVAFTQKALIQYFNHVNASQTSGTIESAIRQKYFDENRKALPPMPDFRHQVKQHLESLLISIKSKGKVVTRNRTHNGPDQSEKTQLTPRGQLHQETYYGSRKCYQKREAKVNGSFTADVIATVAKKAYREALQNRLDAFGGDPKKAFTGKQSLEKSPIWLNEDHSRAVPLKVTLVTLENEYTTRKAIDKTLNIDKVVDPNIRKLLLKRVKEEGADSLNNLQENPIWLNRDKNIDVKRVTISANGSLVAIHHKLTKDGQPVLDENGHTIPNDFVATANNHHAVFFRRQVVDAKTQLPKTDESGQPVYEYFEQIVTLLEAVERAQQGLPVIDKSYGQSEGWQFLLSLKINEYVVFPNEKTGFNPKEIDLTDVNNYALISPNLFRVQKMSQKYYNFRHHLDTTTNETPELRDITWKRCQNYSFLNDIVKVRINHIGQIVSVGEN